MKLQSRARTPRRRTRLTNELAQHGTARRSAPALPDLNPGALASGARANPLVAAGAAGAAGLVLFVAASTLTVAPAAEGSVYKGAGLGGDGIWRLGVPGQSEVLVPGGPFQTENGYLGMWNWEKQVVSGGLTAEQKPEVQARMRAAFEAERKKYDVEAQGQGFKGAEARGIAKKEQVLAEKAAAKAAKEAAKLAAAAAKDAPAAPAAAAKPATTTTPVYYGNMRGIAQPATYGVGAPKK